MSPVRKLGRPRTNFPSPSDFGIELTFEQLGQCMGMTRKKAQAMVVDNGIPVITRGRFRTIHRMVADQLISGEWWTRQLNKAEKEETIPDVQATIPITSRSVLASNLGSAVHGPARADGIGRRPAVIRKKA